MGPRPIGRGNGLMLTLQFSKTSEAVCERSTLSLSTERILSQPHFYSCLYHKELNVRERCPGDSSTFGARA